MQLFLRSRQLPRLGTQRRGALALLILISAMISSAGSLPAYESLVVASTPVVSGPTVIEAPAPRRRVETSGEQRLRLAGPVTGPDSLDPALVRDLSTAFLVRQVFRGLTELDANLNPTPGLADRIEISSDGLTYRFRLREGVSFHDGRAITASDVAASFTRALTPIGTNGGLDLVSASGALGDIVGASELASGLRDDLPGARAIDDRTIDLQLSAPRATFLGKLAGANALIIDPRDPSRGTEWWRSPNGSGPFRVEAWEPEELLTLQRVDNYAAGLPSLETIEFRLGPLASNSFNLYQAGEIDLTEVPVWALGWALDPASDLPGELSIVPQFATAFLAFRPDQAPLTDPHIRRAIQLAFPRELLVTVGFNGLVVTADGLIPSGMMGRTWPTNLSRQDLVAARAEIVASEYGDPANVPPIVLYSAGIGAGEPLRDLLFRDLGLRVEVANAEWEDFSPGIAGGHFPAFEMIWGADYPDPESFLWSLFAADSPDNYVGYDDPVFDDLLRSAAAELDPEGRADLYDRAHRRLIDSGVVLPLYHDVAYTLIGPGLRGLTVTPLGLLYLDDVWMES